MSLDTDTGTNRVHHSLVVSSNSLVFMTTARLVSSTDTCITVDGRNPQLHSVSNYLAGDEGLEDPLRPVSDTGNTPSLILLVG